MMSQALALHCRVLCVLEFTKCDIQGIKDIKDIQGNQNDQWEQGYTCT